MVVGGRFRRLRVVLRKRSGEQSTQQDQRRELEGLRNHLEGLRVHKPAQVNRIKLVFSPSGVKRQSNVFWRLNMALRTEAASGQDQPVMRTLLPMNPPLERDRSPVAAALTACSCRNPPQVADCIRTRCAPGRRALRTPAGSGAQGAIKVRSVLAWVAGSALTFLSASSARADEFSRRRRPRSLPADVCRAVAWDSCRLAGACD